jgi:hypothetical protein
VRVCTCQHRAGKDSQTQIDFLRATLPVSRATLPGARSVSSLAPYRGSFVNWFRSPSRQIRLRKSQLSARVAVDPILAAFAERNTSEPVQTSASPSNRLAGVLFRSSAGSSPPRLLQLRKPSQQDRPASSVHLASSAPGCEGRNAVLPGVLSTGAFALLYVIWVTPLTDVSPRFQPARPVKRPAAVFLGF